MLNCELPFALHCVLHCAVSCVLHFVVECVLHSVIPITTHRRATQGSCQLRRHLRIIFLDEMGQMTLDEIRRGHWISQISKPD